MFSKIINGNLPAFRIQEDDQFLAFLDIFPVAPGHVVVVPKLEIDRAFDLPDEVLAAWLAFAKPIAKALEAVFPCNRCGMAVIGLEVPHAHMHLAPINSANDLNFTKAKRREDDYVLEEHQRLIIAKLEGV